MKKHSLFLNLLGLLLLLTSFSSHARLNVVTTTQDLAAIATAVGGQHIDIISLTPGTRDPHFAVAKPSMIRKVFRADLLLLIGADMEIGWLSPLLQSARNSRVQPGNSGYLDLSNVVTLLGKTSGVITRDMGDVHAKGNPHYWLDPRNGSRMAKAIAERLAQLDPQHASDYQANAITFEKNINRKFVEWRAALKYLKNKSVIAYHRSFLYLANAFGFNIVDEVEPKPGIAPSAASLTKLINRIKTEKISVLIMEPYYERRSSRYLQEQTGIQIAVLPQSVGSQPNIHNYIDLFDGIVKALKSTGVK
jgi:zinc/manganese transport system substrate-binding protein